MRVLVCGGRDYENLDHLYAVLDAAHAACPITQVIHGAARGADSMARDWASLREVPHAPFPADWNAYGRSAGPIRNKQMLMVGRPDLVIAFPGGLGTQNMIEQARRFGVPVQVEKV